MKRVNLIYSHPLYQKKYTVLQEAEKERLFCNHTLEHFIDVARLMYIYSLENGYELPKEIIYATALMHDIGRIDQIQKQIPHEKAGALLCDEILPQCGFDENETAMIKEAIMHHRGNDDESDMLLSEALYWADKKSRKCFECNMRRECNWEIDRMNLDIEY